jgi:hypothetical protein
MPQRRERSSAFHTRLTGQPCPLSPKTRHAARPSAPQHRDAHQLAEVAAEDQPEAAPGAGVVAQRPEGGLQLVEKLCRHLGDQGGGWAPRIDCLTVMHSLGISLESHRSDMPQGGGRRWRSAERVEGGAFCPGREGLETGRGGRAFQQGRERPAADQGKGRSPGVLKCSATVL